MIFKATQEIANALAEKKLGYNIEEDEHTSRVISGINDKIISYSVHFISTSDNNDVGIRVFDLVRFPEGKLESMSQFANECNIKYRYTKFVVDSNDDSLRIEYDVPQCCQNPGDMAVEILIRIIKIVNEIAAEMMRRIWA